VVPEDHLPVSLLVDGGAMVELLSFLTVLSIMLDSGGQGRGFLTLRYTLMLSFLLLFSPFLLPFVPKPTVNQGVDLPGLSGINLIDIPVF